jgi:hypothetical protein
LRNDAAIHILKTEEGGRFIPLRPYKYVLHLDWDYPWPDHWLQEWRKRVLSLLHDEGLDLERIIIKPSPSREGGTHIWIHIAAAKELTDDYINMLQWLLLDHHTRVWINILRVDRGLKKFWNKLFTRHIWKKPLPKRCQKCKLREILNTMREQYFFVTITILKRKSG